MRPAPDQQGLKADIVTEQVKTRRRSTKAEQRAETIEQILDEAEFLFSKHGLHGVTLKDVAKRVGVHHTLLNYYFEDKKKLFDAVFARRAVVTSTERMRALDEYDRATDGKPTSRARCTRSSIPTSISISTAATAGKIMARSARRSPTRLNGAPS
jgi:AcrR family transcriptional regulator